MITTFKEYSHFSFGNKRLIFSIYKYRYSEVESIKLNVSHFESISSTRWIITLNNESIWSFDKNFVVFIAELASNMFVVENVKKISADESAPILPNSLIPSETLIDKYSNC
jgi:hypothetical protein